MRMSNLPSPSKSSTATPCGLVPPTPVFFAIVMPDVAVTSVNRGFGAAAAERVRVTRTRTDRNVRIADNPLSVLVRFPVQQRDRLRVSEKHHPVALRIGAEQMQQLDLITEVVVP